MGARPAAVGPLEPVAPRRTPVSAFVRPQALIVADDIADLRSIVSSLASFGMGAVVAPAPDDALALLAGWAPAVAVVWGGLAVVEPVLHALAGLGVPTLLVAPAGRIAEVARAHRPDAIALAPARPADVAGAANLLAIARGGGGHSGVIELGRLRLDLTRRVALLDGEDLALPPKEFAILRAMALRAPAPLTSSELATLAWPPHSGATGADVRRHVHRLRRLLGDDKREAPLIRNRRGFGYVLKPPGEERETTLRRR